MKAFPDGYTHHQQGMDLRDYFAAMAMQALIARETRLSSDLDMYTGAAYVVADGMMKAREIKDE